MECFVCGNNQWSLFYQKWLKCQTCNFIRAQDKYFRFNPTKIYNANYYHRDQYLDYQADRLILEINFKSRLQTILKYKQRGNLLEIGCAYGYFLALAKQYFKTYGIDISPIVTAAGVSKKQTTIISGDLLKQKFKKAFFDVICLFDTFEHLQQPHLYLQKINRLLKRDGLLVIETGDIESVIAKLQRSKWRLLDPPVHLCYFSRKTITRILEEKGFNVVSINYVGMHRSLSQIIFRLTGVKTNLLGSLYLNLFDIMIVVAKKQ